MNQKYILFIYLKRFENECTVFEIKLKRFGSLKGLINMNELQYSL